MCHIKKKECSFWSEPLLRLAWPYEFGYGAFQLTYRLCLGCLNEVLRKWLRSRSQEIPPVALQQHELLSSHPMCFPHVRAVCKDKGLPCISVALSDYCATGMHSNLPLHAATSGDSPKSTQHIQLPRKDCNCLGLLTVGVFSTILNAEPPQFEISLVRVLR